MTYCILKKLGAPTLINQGHIHANIAPRHRVGFGHEFTGRVKQTCLLTWPKQHRSRIMTFR